MLTFSFFVTNFNVQNKVEAASNVFVSLDGGVTSQPYDFNSDEVRQIIGSSANDVEINFISSCTITAPLEVYANVILKTAGNRTIKRSDNFPLIKNYGNLTINEQDENDVLTLDGSNFPASLIENYATGLKKMTINNIVLCGNGSVAPTHDNPSEFGALYNAGNAIINNITIKNFHAQNGSAIYNVNKIHLNCANISQNKASVGGIIANVGSSADFTIGDGEKPLNKNNLNVKIHDNISNGASSGIVNGTAGQNEKMFVYDCEIYKNLVETNDETFGGAISNFANLTIKFANLHNNTAKCNVQNSGFCAGAGIYNGGSDDFSAICNIYDANILGNSAKIYENGVMVTEKSNGINAVGGGIANFGTLNIYGGSIKNNSAFEGGDLWLGSDELSLGSEKVVFDASLSSIELGQVYLNSANCDFKLKDIDNQSDLTIANFDLSNQIQGDSAIISLQNCSDEEVLKILQSANNIAGFVIENDNVFVRFLITFKTQITGTAQFDEVLTGDIFELKLNGKEATLEEIVGQNNQNTLEFEWYYYPDLTTKTILSTNKQYRIGVGIAGKCIYLTAKIEKEGFVSECLANAQTQQVLKKSLTAQWGSDSPNWNDENSSFEYSSANQYPTIINIDEQYQDYITYSFVDSENQSIEFTRFVGQYCVVAELGFDDVMLDSNSKSYQFSIVKKVVAIPKVKNTYLIVNNQMQTLEFDEVDPIVDIAGHKAISAGDYVATFSLKDKDNYVWEDGTSFDRQIRWRISYPIDPIVFVIIGAIVAVAVVIILIIRYKKRKRQKRIRSGVNTKAINEFNKKS